MKFANTITVCFPCPSVTDNVTPPLTRMAFNTKTVDRLGKLKVLFFQPQLLENVIREDLDYIFAIN